MKQWDFSTIQRRGLVEGVIVENEFADLVRSGRKIRVYQGFDPTSPRLHLGHLLSIRVLRWFQLQGHEVIFLIGDFTGRIGDPTDKLATRKQLTRDEVLANASTYKDQAGKILDFEGTNAVSLKFNNDWLSQLTSEAVIELASKVTVQQMLQREMFQQRIGQGRPVSLHEFVYPLFQGYDSVAMEVDAELGGRDQLFNMMVGRDLVKAYSGKNKHVLTTPLLPGLDGRKMGKTEGNTIDLVEEPIPMFFKLTLIQDSLLPSYLEALTDVEDSYVADIRERLTRELDLRDGRERLAFEIVKTCHGQPAALLAQEEFQNVVELGKLPTDIPEIQVSSLQFPQQTCTITDILKITGLVDSNSDIKRLLRQRAVRINGKQIEDPSTTLPLETLNGSIVKIGNRGYVKVVVAIRSSQASQKS